MNHQPIANPKLVTKLLDLEENRPDSKSTTSFNALSWGEPLAQTNRPAASHYQPPDMTQWLEWLARGGEQQIKQALVQFEQHRPAAAVPDLLQLPPYASAKETCHLKARLALSLIGHSSPASELLAQRITCSSFSNKYSAIPRKTVAYCTTQMRA